MTLTGVGKFNRYAGIGKGRELYADISVPQGDFVVESPHFKQIPAVDHVLAIIGFSLLDGASEPNSALVVTRPKPFADKAADSAQAMIRRISEAGLHIQQANVLPFNLPPIIGLSTSGGFEYQLQALEGQNPAAMSSVASALISAANPIQGLRASFRLSLRPIRPSISTSTAARLRRSASMSAISLPRFGPRLAASMSTTSIFTAYLAGQRAGRGVRPCRYLGHLADLFAQQHRPDGTDKVACRHQDRNRTSGDHPLQQLSFCDRER